MDTIKLHERIAPYAEAAKAAGFKVNVPTSYGVRPAGYVYITREGAPGMALIQVPTFPNFDPVHVDFPIKPSREFGSGVVVDHDDSVEDVLRVLGELVEKAEILPRFVKNPRMVPVDLRMTASVVL